LDKLFPWDLGLGTMRLQWLLSTLSAVPECVLWILLLAWLCRERLLGLLLSRAVKALAASGGGDFDITVERVEVRLGLTSCTLQVSGMTWRNPPGFDRTPHFLTLERASVSVEPRSVADALRKNVLVPSRVGALLGAEVRACRSACVMFQVGTVRCARRGRHRSPGFVSIERARVTLPISRMLSGARCQYRRGQSVA
jgi:hypothetical protein